MNLEIRFKYKFNLLYILLVQVATGGETGQAKASNMAILVWDKDLATFA